MADVDFSLEKLNPEFQQRLAERMKFPWSIAVGFDFQFPATVGERPQPSPDATANAAYMKALGELGTADVEAAEALFLWTHTFDQGQVRRPEIVAKVEAWIAEGRRRPPVRRPRTADRRRRC